MITWQEVLDDPTWKDLSSSEQAQARAFWVDQEIIPELQKAGATESDINGARYEANAKWDNGVGLVSSFGSAAAQGLLNTGTSAVQGLGALVGSEDLERVGQEAQKSVNDTFRTNPLRENTNLVGNVLGNVVGFLGTGGIGGVAGKSLGAAKGLTGLALEAAAETGAQVGSLGTGFLAGAGGGAQDADQYGMTGAERYARVLGGGAVEVLSELAGGTGAELRAIGRIPGLKGVGSGRTGGFLHALGTESGEEVLAQIGGNALNTVLAPEGVQTPGLMSGTLQAAAGGAIGGAAFGGINALRRSSPPSTTPLPPVAPPPSESITRAAQEQALAAGDPAAAAAMQAMNPNPAPVAQTPPEMQDIANPLPALEAQAEIPFDPTLGEEFNPNPQPEPVLPPPDVPGLATDQAAVEAQAAPQPELPQAQARAAEIQAPTELPPLPPDGPFLINDGREELPPVAAPAPAPVVEEPALPPGQPIAAPVQQDSGPELDLFGEPIEPEQGTSSLAGLETQEVPLDQITLSPDVPQFKSNADSGTGVVEKLGGKFERLGVGPILLWRRNNGKLEVISGRHRLDLARRSGERTIPSQIVDEARGFTRAMALTADAELNIRDEKGTVKDFALYFRNSQLGAEEAEQRGLLARAQGRAGFAIGRNGTDALFDLYQNSDPDKFSDKAAEEIANAAPGNEGLQRIGISNVLAGHPINFSVNMMRAAQASMAGGSSSGQQLDLFGADDTAMETMRRQAKNATSIQNRIREQISAVRGAAKRPDLAAKLGVNVNNPAELKSTLERLSAELERWQNWPMHPDLVAQTREDATGGMAVQQSLNLPAAPSAASAENDLFSMGDMSVSPEASGNAVARALRPAYDRLVQRSGADSVFISDLINESGLPADQVKQWLRDYGINQGQATLDEGDWSTSTEEQRAAHVMLRGRERLYVRLHPGIGTGPAQVQRQAQAQAQPQPTPITSQANPAISLKDGNRPLWDEGATRLTRMNFTGDLDAAIEALMGPDAAQWVNRNTKPSNKPVTQRKALLEWARRAMDWNESQRQQPLQSEQQQETAPPPVQQEAEPPAPGQPQPQHEESTEPEYDGPSVFGQHGRITQRETEMMAAALRRLGVSRANIVINETGFPPGATNVMPGVKGQRVTDGQSDTIYLNRNLVTADTPLHEVFHGLIPELRAGNRQLYQQGVDLIRNSPALREIRQQYGPMGYSEERMIEEALATVLGNESPAWLRNYSQSAPWVQALMRWIAKVRVWLNDTFGNAGIDPDMTLEEFARGINRRVLAGNLRETGLRQRDAAEMRQDVSLRAVPMDNDVPVRNFQNATVAGPGGFFIRSFSITAYHGTPHRVREFRTGRIGTGEGAQVYGWGLYFAQDIKTAEHYKETLGRNALTADGGDFDHLNQRHLAGQSVMERGGAAEAIDYLDNVILYFEGTPEQRKELRQRIDLIEAGDYAKVEQKPGGNLYTVNLGLDESQLLDWDTARHSQEIQTALDAAFRDAGLNAAPVNRSGKDVVRDLTKRLGSSRAASEHLLAHGIRGIQYLDGNSRTVAQGDGSTRNYVVFDDADIRITAENGNPVPLESVPAANNQQRDFSLSPEPREQRDAAGRQAQTDLSLDPNQAPREQKIIPTGLSENQPNNPVRQMVNGINYRGESGEQAMAEATALYNAGQAQGWDFQQHMGQVTQLLARTQGTFNMTPGAYMGLMAHGLALMKQDTSLSMAEREAARTNLRTLMDLTAGEAAAGGQFVKGFDLYLRIMNDPEIQVENMSMRAAVGGEQAALKEFRQVARTIQQVMQELQNEALRTMPQAEAATATERTAARLAQGDDTAIEGEIAIEEELTPEIERTEREASVTDQDWFKAGVEQMSAQTQALVDEWLIVLESLSLDVQDGSDFSLTPTERSAKAAELRQQFTRQQRVKMAEDLFRQISRQRVEATGPYGPQDVKGMVKDRLTKNLNRLLNGKAKRKKSSAEQIAATIANVLLAKAGHGTTIPAGQDALVFAMGLALSNQQLARESVADIHGMLQSNAETKDAISQEKLKGFMSLMTGNDLSSVQGEAVPYGERQIAQLLRNELAIQNTTLAQSVRTAALQGQTVEQLEANLRDPFRGLSEAFEPAVLDRIVNAVKAQYSKSAKERAETIARRQANRDALAGAVREARNEQREKRQGMERARREQERANERVLREQERAREMEVRRASAEERKQLARDIREARAEQRQKRQAFLRAERLNQEALDRAERAELRRAVDEAKRDARDRKRAHLRAERNNRAADRRARVQDMRQNPGAAPEVRFQELNEEERRRLLSQPRNRVIDYLAREFGFNVNDIVDIARGEDRQATLEQRVLDLADQLGLTREQAEEFMRPVVAEAMKRVDGKRKKEAERKINDAISKLNGTFGRKAKKQPTAVERLRRLMELGGLDVTGIEKVLLNSVDAKEFSPEFKDWLQKMVARSNDPSLPQTERNDIIVSMNTAIRSAQGASLIGLFGEWVMSNIFFGLSTFKVNAFWGGVKAVSDSVVYAQRAIPRAVQNEFGIQTRGLGTALFKQAMRGYSSDLQYHSKYLFKTGRSALESDYTTKFTESEFELLAAFPDTQIKKWLNGEPLSPFWANKVKTLAKFSKYVRRTMVATDLLHRNQAYEMLKAGAIVKLIAEKGGTIPNTAEAWTRAIDDAMYGGDFQAAKQDAMRQADDDIAAGRAQPQERGILFGEYLDRKLGESLGISDSQRQEILDNATERAKRWTNADQAQGILGVISTKMMEAAREIPGLRFLMPAIRMPINAFSQGLDWSPYAFLRYMTIKQSGNRSSSFTNHLFNRDGAKKSWHMPAQGVTEEEKIELMTKATLGTATMVALFLAAALEWDKDDDEADFYITGRGPTDPQQAKLWRERGYRPFMIRIGGVGVNYQESPAFAPLAVLGATSDANRYGKPEDTRSDKLAYAITRSMGAFADAAVLRNLQDVLAGVTGNQTYNPQQAGSWTSRLAGVAVFPRVGSEINTILWGPQSTKELGWAARALGNVPFIPAITNRPALNWFGEEIHGERGGPMGEVLPLLAHRISPIPLDDDQMEFVAKMGAAPLQTRRRLKNGDQVMEDYDLMRQWAANSGKALRKWLTPEVMARYRRQFAQDRDQAEKDFDEAVREIRNNELMKFPTVQF